MSISHNLNTYTDHTPVWRVPLLWNSDNGSFFLTTAEVLSEAFGGYEGVGTDSFPPKIDDADLIYHRVGLFEHYFSLIDSNNRGNLSAFGDFSVQFIGWPIDPGLGSYILGPNTIVETLGGQGVPLKGKYRFTFRDGTTGELKEAVYREDSKSWYISMTDKERYECLYVEIAMSGSENAEFFDSYKIVASFPGSTYKLAFPPTNLDNSEDITESRRSEVRMFKKVNGTMKIQNGTSSFTSPCSSFSSFGNKNVGISKTGDFLHRKSYELLERTYMYHSCKVMNPQRPIVYNMIGDTLDSRMLNKYYDLEEWFREGGTGWESRFSDFVSNCPLSTGVFVVSAQEVQSIRYTVGGLFKSTKQLNDVNLKADIGIGCTLGVGIEDHDISLTHHTFDVEEYNVKKLFLDRDGQWYYYFEAEVAQDPSSSGNLCTVSTPVIIYKGQETNITFTYLSAYITLR